MNSNTNKREWLIFTAAILVAISVLIAAKIPDLKRSLSIGRITDNLVPHRAVYDLKLKSLSNGTQMVNLSGQITFEWNKTCDGAISLQEFDAVYEYADTPSVNVTSNASSYEDNKGHHLDFTSQRRRNGMLTEYTRGHANKKEGSVTLNQPKQPKMPLDKNVVFPTAHSKSLLKAIYENKTFHNIMLYDGSDLNGPSEVNAFIGRKASPVVAETYDEDINAALLSSPAHHIQLAFFPVEQAQEQADYEMSLIFHENGVMRDILIEYNDFSMTQKLTSLEMLEAQCQN